VRLSENDTLVERIVIRIKVFKNGKWDWKVRQRFHKEPHIKVHDFLKIIDEIKDELIKTDGKELIESPAPQPSPCPSPPQANNNKNDAMT
jgi:hypothetical protein